MDRRSHHTGRDETEKYGRTYGHSTCVLSSLTTGKNNLVASLLLQVHECSHYILHNDKMHEAIRT